MTLVNSELEWKEENWDVDSLILTDLDNLKLARVWLWSYLLLSFALLGLVGLLLFGRPSSIFILLLWLHGLLILLVNDRYAEHHILGEWVVELNVDLGSLIKLGRLVDRVHRVPLVYI